MNSEVGLVRAITGQERAYLAGFLLAKGEQGQGVKRRISPFDTRRIDHPYRDARDRNHRFCPQLRRHEGLVEPGPYHPAGRGGRDLLSGVTRLVAWGTGTPLRALLYSDDMVDICSYLVDLPVGIFDRIVRRSELPLTNIGAGKGPTTRGLTAIVAGAVGFRGVIEFDPSKFSATPRKLLDTSRVGALGWAVRARLRDGTARTYPDFLDAGAGSSASGAA